MKNFDSVIQGLSKSGLLSGFAGGLAGGAVSGALMSKKGRKMGKSALKLGALAAVGGVAWKAYQAYSQKNQSNMAQTQPAYTQGTSATGTISESQYIPSKPKQQLTYSPSSLQQRQFEQVIADESNDSGPLLILRAMITAANADGHIDEHERQRIYDQVDQLQLSTQDKAQVFDEIRRPLQIQQLVDAVPDSQTAIEVYAASVLAIDHSQQASQDYLQRLARNLMIPRELIEAIHDQANQMD
jgi:uncharacterized membrane protein YebE (DUF533 family)